MSADFETQLVSCERVMEYGKLESEAELKIEGKEPPREWPTFGEIVFRKVSLWYSKTMPAVLKDISFEIEPGEKVGIVGRTGAGKSSLVSILFRLVEPEGVIMIDNVDIQSIGLHDLRTKISIIPQDPVLFSGTIRQNLDPFREYTDDQLWTALRESNLASAVNSMSGKLDAAVTEGGSNLSVGQRQLLCLARALLKNNKILVLDEATANVDQETDAQIQKTIKNQFKECTILTVAHRLNTIIEMDKVLVLDSGRIVEFDEPYLLLKNRNGIFSAMVEQTGDLARGLHRLAETAYFKKHKIFEDASSEI